MAFLNSLNISASAFTAEKTRLNIISENVSNLDTTRTEDGGPYTRKLVVFQSTESKPFRRLLSERLSDSAVGVKLGGLKNEEAGVIVKEIVEDRSDYKRVYDPDHPDADENGYVLYPNTELIKETVDAMAATRAYQANITALNAMKAMAQNALEIGQ